MYNVVTGLWPVLHMTSFEAVLGPKSDRWLVRDGAGWVAAWLAWRRNNSG